MAAVFYRYRDESGAWVVTDRLDAVPEALRSQVEQVVLPDLPPGPNTSPEASREAGPERGASAPSELIAWIRRAKDELGPGAAAVSRIDGPSFGFGFGLGLTVFVVYACVRRAGRLLTRLALVALAVALVGASLAGMWIAPRVPGAPEWLMTPDELIREAKRVADEAAPENRLGDLE